MVLTSLQVEDIDTSSLKSLNSFVAHKKIVIPNKYSNFADIFLEKLAVELSHWIKIKKHAIDPKIGKQPSYGLIYSIKLKKLETLKIYTWTNQANNFT